MMMSTHQCTIPGICKYFWMNFQKKYPSPIPPSSQEKTSNSQSNAQSISQSNSQSNPPPNAHIQYLCVIHEDVQKSMSITCGSAATNLMVFQDNFLRRIFHKVHNHTYIHTYIHKHTHFKTQPFHTYEHLIMSTLL